LSEEQLINYQILRIKIKAKVSKLGDERVTTTKLFLAFDVRLSSSKIYQSALYITGIGCISIDAGIFYHQTSRAAFRNC